MYLDEGKGTGDWDVSVEASRNCNRDVTLEVSPRFSRRGGCYYSIQAKLAVDQKLSLKI